MFASCTDRVEWNAFMNGLQTKAIKDRHVRASKRRARICSDILRYALGSHTVENAFFKVNCASDYGVYGHTISDLMHALEEGIFKYLEFIFLHPLSDSQLGDLDDYVTDIFGPEVKWCFGSHSFPRVNFSRGFS
jgi:hypothetical protein